MSQSCLVFLVLAGITLGAGNCRGAPEPPLPGQTQMAIRADDSSRYYNPPLPSLIIDHEQMGVYYAAPRYPERLEVGRTLATNKDWRTLLLENKRDDSFFLMIRGPSEAEPIALVSRTRIVFITRDLKISRTVPIASTEGFGPNGRNGIYGVGAVPKDLSEVAVFRSIAESASPKDLLRSLSIITLSKQRPVRTETIPLPAPQRLLVIWDAFFTPSGQLSLMTVIERNGGRAGFDLVTLQGGRPPVSRPLPARDFGCGSDLLSPSFFDKGVTLVRSVGIIPSDCRPPERGRLWLIPVDPNKSISSLLFAEPLEPRSAQALLLRSEGARHSLVVCNYRRGLTRIWTITSTEQQNWNLVAQLPGRQACLLGRPTDAKSAPRLIVFSWSQSPKRVTVLTLPTADAPDASSFRGVGRPTDHGERRRAQPVGL